MQQFTDATGTIKKAFVKKQFLFTVAITFSFIVLVVHICISSLTEKDAHPFNLTMNKPRFCRKGIPNSSSVSLNSLPELNNELRGFFSLNTSTAIYDSNDSTQTATTELFSPNTSPADYFIDGSGDLVTTTTDYTSTAYYIINSAPTNKTGFFERRTPIYDDYIGES